jgi:transmembrane sensor
MSHKQRTFPEALKDALGTGPNSDRLLRQRARLIEWEERRRRSGILQLFAGRGRTFSLGMGLALAAFVAVLLLRSPERAALTAELDGSALQPNAWVTATDGDHILRFSEGSEVTVAEGTRARVAELGVDGLRVTLEGGKLTSSITPKTGYRWVVQAGPHTVTVLGTVFSVEWSSEQQRLHVEVKRGRVQVQSDNARELPRVLAAGESWSIVPPTAVGAASTQAVTGASSSLVFDSLAQDPQAPSASPGTEADPTLDVTAPSGSEAQPLPGGPSRRRRPAMEPTAHAPGADPGVDGKAAPSPSAVASDAVSWKKLAEAGRYSEAVSAARAVGLPTLFSGTSATDLMLLADAARLGKAPELAQQVLLTIRDRYPSHPNATVAAFALGRLAIEVRHDDKAAVHWFQTYLDASPNGSMAEGARGRLLRAWLRLGDRQNARTAAAQYLQHHPHGRHASVAQSLLGD